MIFNQSAEKSPSVEHAAMAFVTGKTFMDQHTRNSVRASWDCAGTV